MLTIFTMRWTSMQERLGERKGSKSSALMKKLLVCRVNLYLRDMNIISNVGTGSSTSESWSAMCVKVIVRTSRLYNMTHCIQTFYYKTFCLSFRIPSPYMQQMALHMNLDTNIRRKEWKRCLQKSTFTLFMINKFTPTVHPSVIVNHMQLLFVKTYSWTITLTLQSTFIASQTTK